MSGESIVIKDDGYDELDGIFGSKADIPGDEITGEVIDDDTADKSDSVDDDKSADADDKDDKASDGTASEDDKDDIDNDDSAISDKSKDDTVDDTVEDADKDDGKDATTEDDLPDSEVELRAELRAQRKQAALIEAKLDTMARQRKADAEAAENDDDAKPVMLSTVELYQEKLNTIADVRGEVILDMLELMKINPKYADVETVCSKDNLDDTLELLARSQIAKDGGDLVETTMGLEVDIWSQRNPYSYMYGVIKEVHPKYQDDNAGDNKQDTSKDKKTNKAPAKAPLSAVDLTRGGGNKNIGKWTAEKIDNLPESALDSVPKDVYNAYMRGELDK